MCTIGKGKPLEAREKHSIRLDSWFHAKAETTAKEVRGDMGIEELLSQAFPAGRVFPGTVGAGSSKGWRTGRLLARIRLLTLSSTLRFPAGPGSKREAMGVAKAKNVSVCLRHSCGVRTLRRSLDCVPPKGLNG